jgi:hypothetical protein
LYVAEKYLCDQPKKAIDFLLMWLKPKILCTSIALSANWRTGQLNIKPRALAQDQTVLRPDALFNTIIVKNEI